MGIRVQYWEIPKADIRKAVIDDFDQMKNWYESIGKEFPEDIDYDLLESIESILEPDKLFEELNQNKIDELIALYIGEFCDYGPGKKNEIKNTSMLNIRNYINDQKAVNEKCRPETRKFWEYILKGRSIVGSKTFNISDVVFRFCYLTESECQAFSKDLVDKFDTSHPNGFNRNPGIGSVIEAIRNKKGVGILITVA